MQPTLRVICAGHKPWHHRTCVLPRKFHVQIQYYITSQGSLGKVFLLCRVPGGHEHHLRESRES